MQVKPECVPCYFTQVLSALKHANLPSERQTQILYQVAQFIPELPVDETPSHNSTLILRQACHLMGIEDPYLTAKRVSNQKALQALQRLPDYHEVLDPMLYALRLAVAGNVIDLGIRTDYDIENSLKEALQHPLDAGAYCEFLKALSKARSVLIVGDNSGEIVFDRVVIRVLKEMRKDVAYAVKSSPILNDATREDAEAAGITRLVPVIETGNGFLGVEWEECSEEFRSTFLQADVVLAKGQANYESLEGTPWAGDKTFFLLKAKCPVVAEHLGVPLGEWVLRRNKIRD